MLTRIQNWLFPKVPLLPLQYDDEGYQVCFGGGRRHKTIRMDEEAFVFIARYSPKNPFTGAGRDSPAYPPLHFHYLQTEWLKILQGRVGWVVEKEEGIACKGETVELPKGKVHKFWCDPTSEEDAVMEFTIRPGQGLDEQWLNNLYGILDSHYQAKKPVSFLQLMVIWDESASAPGAVPKPIGVLMSYVFGRIIGRLAGYKGSYPIYSQSRLPK